MSYAATTTQLDVVDQCPNCHNRSVPPHPWTRDANHFCQRSDCGFPLFLAPGAEWAPSLPTTPPPIQPSRTPTPIPIAPPMPQEKLLPPWAAALLFALIVAVIVLAVLLLVTMVR